MSQKQAAPCWSSSSDPRGHGVPAAAAPRTSYDELPEAVVPPWLQGQSRNVYSQSGEDGLIAAIFAHLGHRTTPGARWCCEVGAGDGLFCSNTRLLIEQGWRAVLIERDPERFAALQKLYEGNERVKLYQRDIIETPLETVLTEAGAPLELDLLCIDVDGPDYYVWNELLEYHPLVVLCEYDPGVAPEFIPTRDAAIASDPNVQGGLCQAGMAAIQRLSFAKQYRPICATKTNVVSVRSDHVQPSELTPPPAVEVTNEPLRLNLGSGEAGLPGYVNIDLKTGGMAFPLPQYEDNSVDEVRASHVLEHFSHRDVVRVVNEWVRVLKPGGMLKVAVPNFGLLTHAYNTGQNCNLQGVLMGGHVDDADVHKCAFDAPLLRSILRDADLREITGWHDVDSDCSALQVSLNLCGVKWPVPVGAISRDVFAVMTCPRVCWTDPAFSIIEACMRLPMSIERMHGAYWNQCIEQLLERHADSKYILTIDYDTVFQPADVETLYCLLERHPDVDAVFGVQMKRENDIGLFVRTNPDGSFMTEIPFEDLHAPLMQCRSGHFGLTLIRTAAFERMGPKPWFIGVPDKNSRWSGESIDADIQFWIRWAEAGNTLYQANHVMLGHLQLVVTWPDERLKCIQQYVSDYNEHGRPVKAWLGG